MRFLFAAFSDRGPSPENQDEFGCLESGDTLVACVADGVGGAAQGGKAASVAVRAYMETFGAGAKLELVALLKTISKRLVDEDSSGGMVTAFSGLLISDGLLRGAHSGDTRISVLRGNGIRQLTEDHTEYARFLKEGKLSREDAENYPRKHVLESALGAGPDPRVDAVGFELQAGDRVLLTTDGVHRLLSKRELRDMSKAAKDVGQFVRQVVARVQEIGPNDNYTLVALDCK